MLDLLHMAKKVLSDSDLGAIKAIIEVAIDEKLDAKLEEKLTEKLKYLPSKEEFYSKMDEIMSELKKIREEHPVLTSQVANLNERVAVLEKN